MIFINYNMLIEISYNFGFLIKQIIVDKLRITATSYLNTVPFVYGIRNSGKLLNYELKLEVPSACAYDLIKGNADIGLVPVAFIPELENEYDILYDYCLGANGKVKTVLLLSRLPLEEIKNVFLDFESGTSVRLVKVLVENYWKLKNIQWHNIENKNTNEYIKYDSVVAIGDKTFDLAGKYKYVYDLAHEWYLFTSLPFVFACWMKRKDINGEVIKQFTEALTYGVNNKFEAVRKLKKEKGLDIDLEEYVDKYMSYEFDERKQKALRLFLEYIKY
jgi:chorismate dehydratase